MTRPKAAHGHYTGFWGVVLNVRWRLAILAVTIGRMGGQTRTLVLGLGNPVLSDDSVGLRVACLLRERLAGREGIEVDEDYWGGLRLMERMVGYDRAIVIDAICTGGEPGTLHQLSPDAIPTQHSASAHDVNLPTALELGRQAGAHLPANDAIVLIGIEADELLTFSEACTPLVEAAIPRAADAVQAILDAGIL